VDVERCPECPARKLDDSMRTPLGLAINHAFRLRNLMKAYPALTLPLASLDEREARILEIIENEMPKPHANPLFQS
jgi:hypothetical protein